MCRGPLRPSTRHRPESCRVHTFQNFPNTFEELDQEIKRWMHLCVTSRTRDGNGVPLRREIHLVDDSNLMELWDESLSGRRGQTVTIRVQYMVDAQEQLRLVFATGGARVRTGEAVVSRIEPALDRLRDFQETRFIVLSRPDTNISIVNEFTSQWDLADPSNIPGFLSIFPRFRSLNVLPEILTGTQMAILGAGITTLQMGYRALEEGDRASFYQGLIIGYAYSLAYMARSLPSTGLEQHTNYAMPANLPTTGIPGVTHITRPFSEGYRGGVELAISLMRRLDSAQSTSPTRPSIDFLLQLKEETNGSVNATFQRILRVLPSRNVIPSSFRSIDQ